MSDNNDTDIAGVGSFLRQDFETIGVGSCPACWQLAQQMDREGLIWCERNFDWIVEQIHVNARERKWTHVLDAALSAIPAGGGQSFGDRTYGYFLTRAIDKERKRVNEIADDIVQDIDRPYVERDKGWETKFEVQTAHRMLLDRVAADDHPYPEGVFSGRGIVIQGGGGKYFPSSYALIRLLREKLGCSLPIELWCLDRREIDNVMHRVILDDFEDVVVVDGKQRIHGAERQPRMWGGWQSKVWSIMFSAFEEVLFLDADNVPVRDPRYMFDDPRYTETGCVLWPDLKNVQGMDIHPVAFWTAGLEMPGNEFMPEHDKPTDYRPVESGQVMVDKQQHWHALEVCAHINDHSDFWYREGGHRNIWWVYGDKSTFYLAWEKTGLPYAMPRDCDWTGNSKGGAFLQYDFQDRVLFQHRCQPPSKLSLFHENIEPPQFEHHDHLQESVDRLKKRWGGIIWDWRHQGPNDHEVAKKLVGCHYTLFGIAGADSVPIMLEPAGRVKRNDTPRPAGWRWSIRHAHGTDPHLVIADDRAALTILGPDDIGNWVNHAEGHHAAISPPPDWRMMRGPHELGMWAEVSLRNEYRLPPSFEPDDVVIDVGAHVGTFTVECLKRGCGLVIAFEPDPQNFEDLAANTRGWADRVVLIKAAAWNRHDILNFARPGGAYHTGGGALIVDGPLEAEQRVPAVPMWDVCRSIIGPTRPIRFLKLDCEGAEWSLLADEAHLRTVQQLGGEWHTRWVGDPYGVEWLADRLSGFSHVDIKDNVEFLGWFWADRR